MQKRNKMETMPIGRLILTMSGPPVLSMLIQALYNVVDSIFVSRIAEGERALEALTIIFPVQLLMISIGVGTAIGINSLISRSLGAKLQEKADMTAGNGLRLSIFGWIFFAVMGFLFSGKFMEIFASNKTVVDYGTSYLTIVTVGCLFMMVGLTSEKIVQATGNMIYPMISVISGAVVNTVLDPILIFGLLGAPEMGIAGAAVATVIGQMFNAVIIFTLLMKKTDFVHVDLKHKFEPTVVKEIYKVGAPAIVMQATGSLMMFGLNAILAGISGTVVAVLGVYNRLQSFVFMPVIGINQGTMPIIGFNYGARNRERLMSAFKKAFILAFTVMVLGFLTLQIFPHFLLSLFNATEEMYDIGIPALRTISFCLLPASFGIVSSGFFQATGHGTISLISSLIRQLVGTLPLAFIFSRIGGADMTWWAFAAAELLGAAYSAFMLKFLYENKISHLEDTVL